MIELFLGTDRKKAHLALSAAAEKKGGDIIRITDASALADMSAVVAGGGLFLEKRTVIFDSVFCNEESWAVLLGSLEHLATSDDSYLMYEEKLDAVTKKRIEKISAHVSVFELPKKAKVQPSVFLLVNHLRTKDKKNMWISYQAELAQGNTAEAIHGVLFWGAKQLLLQSRTTKDAERARKYIVTLTELPHEARRRGVELEYALEQFTLSI